MTAALQLVSMTAELMEALGGGRRDEAERLLGAAIPANWPDAHDAGFLALRARQLRDGKHEQRWLVYALMRDGELVGHAGFHGNPGLNAKQRPDAVELGYTVFEPYRGRGYATEAVRALLELARREGATGAVLSIAPTNAPSLAIARKLGFVQTGSHCDEEDGEELEFELDL